MTYQKNLKNAKSVFVSHLVLNPCNFRPSTFQAVRQKQKFCKSQFGIMGKYKKKGELYVLLESTKNKRA